MAHPSTAVRTTLHLSPAVAVGALVAAQRRGLRLREWLDDVVVDAVTISTDDENAARDSMTEATASLFVRIATHAPELLAGRWRILYERVRLDGSLWRQPESTIADIESGSSEIFPSLDEGEIRRRWPALIAECFLL